MHRDRDSLTQKEVDYLEKNYNKEGVSLWITENSDIEAYFCNSALISAIFGREKEDYDTLIKDTARECIDNKNFQSQRQSINQEIYTKGGSPSDDDVIAELEKTPLRRASGKKVFGKLHDGIKIRGFNNPKQLLNYNFFNLKEDQQVALDLKKKITEIVKNTDK